MFPPIPPFRPKEGRLARAPVRGADGRAKRDREESPSPSLTKTRIADKSPPNGSGQLLGHRHGSDDDLHRPPTRSIVGNCITEDWTKVRGTHSEKKKKRTLMRMQKVLNLFPGLPQTRANPVIKAAGTLEHQLNYSSRIRGGKNFQEAKFRIKKCPSTFQRSRGYKLSGTQAGI